MQKRRASRHHLGLCAQRSRPVGYSSIHSRLAYRAGVAHRRVQRPAGPYSPALNHFSSVPFGAALSHTNHAYAVVPVPFWTVSAG